MANKRTMSSCEFTSNDGNQTCGEPCEEIRGKSIGLCMKHLSCLDRYQYIYPGIYPSFSGDRAVCNYNQLTCVTDDFIEVDGHEYVCSLCYNRHYKGGPSIETLKNYPIRTDQIRAELSIEEQQ